MMYCNPGTLSCLLFLTVLLEVQVGSGDEAGVSIQTPLVVVVRRGRTTRIDISEQLDMHVVPGEPCFVSALLSNAVSPRVGLLSPTNFDCEYANGSLRYTHFGGASPNSEDVRLLIRRDSSKSSVFVPLTIRLNFVEDTNPLVIVKKPVTVRKLGGYSGPLDSATLTFERNDSAASCLASILQTGGNPRFGVLANSTFAANRVPCSEFTSAGFRYKHSNAGLSPSLDMDSIPLLVELVDKDTEQVTEAQQTFVPVSIEGGRPNLPPTFGFEALMEVTVHRSVVTPVTPSILSAEDDETSPDLLMFDIIHPLHESGDQGQLVSTDDPSVPLQSFLQRDVYAYKIVYLPPVMKSGEKMTVSIPLRVVDSEGLVSQVLGFTFTVLPEESLGSLITKNNGLRLLEGQSATLLLPRHLHLSEVDSETVTISTVQGPIHGSLLPATFTRKDLESGNVVYTHDGSEASSDNIIMQISDGDRSVEFLFPVTIYPVDDSAPMLSVNTGISIYTGASFGVSTSQLSAIDVDSLDAEIRYVVTAPSPASSQVAVILRSASEPHDLRGWVHNPSAALWEKKVGEWTQKDIVEGRVFYKDIAEPSSSMRTNTVEFTMWDSADPPNVSPVYEFKVSVTPTNSFPPRQHSGASWHLIVRELTLTPFDKSVLRYTDEDSPDKDLVYSLTGPPYSTDPRRPGPEDTKSYGAVINVFKPKVNLTSWKQSQINHGRIAFRPPPYELGFQQLNVSIKFTVSDTSGNYITDQLCRITIVPINNQPPVVSNMGAELDEHGFVVVTPNMLHVRDVDTHLNSVYFIIEELPLHGTLLLNGQTCKVGQSFVQSNIIAGFLVYIHTGDSLGGDAGSGHIKDILTLDVYDGAHHVPVHFPFTIQPLYDSLYDPSTLPGELSIQVGEKMSVALTSEELGLLETAEIDLEGAAFSLTVPPLAGDLAIDGKPVDRFPFYKLSSGSVFYKHTSGEVGLTSVVDSFTLLPIDQSTGMELHNFSAITVQVVITPRDDTPPTLISILPLQVEEGGEVIVTSDHLHIEDIDTRPKDIVCAIHIRPSRGQLESVAPGRGSEIIPAPGTAVFGEFTAVDILNEFVVYRQYEHEGTEPRSDMFTVICSDKSSESEEAVVTVDIVPVVDEPPMLTILQSPWTVSEGGDLSIDSSLLHAEDKDFPPNMLMFNVSGPPQHGSLFARTGGGGEVRVTSFTLDEISHVATVVYRHDGSESLNDLMTLNLTDGTFFLEKTVSIKILPVDDIAPAVLVNAGLIVEITGSGESERSSSAVISRSKLRAEDIDSYNPYIEFVILQKPLYGILEIKSKDKNSSELSWTPLGELSVAAGEQTMKASFLQGDVDAKIVRYRHTGRVGVRDVIRVDVRDHAGNTLKDQRIYVDVVGGRDRSPPEVVNRGLTLNHSRSAVLSTHILSAHDESVQPERLVFTITKLADHGRVELVNNPGKRIRTFTQLDLAAGRVRYTYSGPSSESAQVDSFSFEVTDGYNPIHRAFHISVVPSDVTVPVLMWSPVRVNEVALRVISTYELFIQDVDTSNDKLSFTVVKSPSHGTLKLKGESDSVTTFTMSDIMAGRVSYRHTDPESLTDSFSVTVSDGTNTGFYVSPERLESVSTAEFQIPIEISGIDNSIPQLLRNVGCMSLTALASEQETSTAIGRGLGCVLSHHILLVEDEDTVATRLLYSLVKKPRHGILRNKEGREVMEWTQDDIDRKQVTYHLTGSLEVTEDNFKFTVTDQGGHVIESQTFELHWSYVSFATASLSSGERDGRSKVKLIRRGNIRVTSYVGVSVTDSTTTAGEDYHESYPRQIQFEPGMSEQYWTLRIKDDSHYERQEDMRLSLNDPVNTALEGPNSATLSIYDEEDESAVSFVTSKVSVRESVGSAKVLLRRTGDISREMFVICSTTATLASQSKDLLQTTIQSEDSFQTLSQPEVVFHSGHIATSSHPGDVLETGTDYVSRLRSKDSVIRFGPGVSVRPCRVKVVDDVFYEDSETFELLLSDPVGGRLGKKRTNATVTILSDPQDEPTYFFEKTSYTVAESDAELYVTVVREGTDLSNNGSVDVRSREWEKPEALANVDYMAVKREIHFGPGESRKMTTVSIVDDTEEQRLEGRERFQLVLRKPSGGKLAGGRSNCSVIIDDSEEDVPVFEFSESIYTILEDSGLVIPIVRRRGDLSQSTSVRCVTRQGTASVDVDYKERPDKEESTITFNAGVDSMPCQVTIVNDPVFELTESLRLVLTSPLTKDGSPVRVGPKDTATLNIKDDGDDTLVYFASPRVDAKEPQRPGHTRTVTLSLRRVGDLRQRASVLVQTKDVTATSSKDYLPLAKEIVFGINSSLAVLDVTLLYDAEVEHWEAFQIILKQGSIGHVKIEETGGVAIVRISDDNPFRGIVFPAPPVVMVAGEHKTSTQLLADRSVVCVTACDPRYPSYDLTKEACLVSGINSSFFDWAVSSSQGQGVRKERPYPIRMSTFFSPITENRLDPLYFKEGSSVQCVAYPVSRSGDIGVPSRSSSVDVSTRTLGCSSPVQHTPVSATTGGVEGARPFSSSIRFTGVDHATHPNSVEIIVTVPHINGIVPVLSTEPLIDLPRTLALGEKLSPSCSNLSPGRWQPLGKTGETLTESVNPFGFYDFLSREACTWTFVSYRTISELVTECGASITSFGGADKTQRLGDENRSDLADLEDMSSPFQSVQTLSLPIHVYHVTYLASERQWGQTDLSTNLDLEFTYDTARSWQHAIPSEEESWVIEESEKSEVIKDTPSQADLYLKSIRTNRKNRLVVHFETETHFRGQFVQQNEDLQSRVSVGRAEEDEFSLVLLETNTRKSSGHSVQQWKFVSAQTDEDHSGVYKIELVACELRPNHIYSGEDVCPSSSLPPRITPFHLTIRLQPITSPVPPKYTLGASIDLSPKATSSNSAGVAVQREGEAASQLDASRSVYSRDDVIRGGVSIGRATRESDSARAVKIDKVFVCSGGPGYVPKYRPEQDEYGCMKPSPDVAHSFKLIDNSSPDSQVTRFNSVPFHTKTWTTAAADGKRQFDGFEFDSKPLFQADPGRLWFIHTVYSVTKRDESSTVGTLTADSTQTRGRRSLSNPSHNISESQTSLNDDQSVLGTGTNMLGFMTSFESHTPPDDGTSDGDSASSEQSPPWLYGVLAVILGVVMIIAAAMVIVSVVKRRAKSPPTSPPNGYASAKTVIVEGKAVVTLPIELTLGGTSEV